MRERTDTSAPATGGRPDGGIVDDGAELGFDDPFTRWAVLVTYPNDRGGKYAGCTARVRHDSERTCVAAASWHRANGATTVQVQHQVWAPGPWEAAVPVPPPSDQKPPNATA